MVLFGPEDILMLSDEDFGVLCPQSPVSKRRSAATFPLVFQHWLRSCDVVEKRGEGRATPALSRGWMLLHPLTVQYN